jgi:hypothetical protein
MLVAESVTMRSRISTRRLADYRVTPLWFVTLSISTAFDRLATEVGPGHSETEDVFDAYAWLPHLMFFVQLGQVALGAGPQGRQSSG